MDAIIQRTPVYELVRSPLYELGDASDFKEESETLVATINDPVETTNEYNPNWTEKDPTSIIATCHAMNWTSIASHSPYNAATHFYRQYGGPAGYAIPDWSEPNRINGVSTSTTGMWPHIPESEPGSSWQVNAIQASLWIYDPQFQTKDTLFYWDNSLYCQRTRFRCNRTVSVWKATATIYNASNTGSGWFVVHYDDEGTTGIIFYGMISAAVKYSGPTSLAANTWCELPDPPNTAMPSRSNGLIGQMNFAIYKETPAAFSSRTGITIT